MPTEPGEKTKFVKVETTLVLRNFAALDILTNLDSLLKLDAAALEINMVHSLLA